MTGTDELLLSDVLEYAKRRVLETLLAKCESPIESTMALALLRQSGAWPRRIFEAQIDDASRLGPGVVAPQLFSSVEWIRGADNAALWLVPQLRIHLGEAEARLDFALVLRREDGSFERRIAIECDGHDFHDRTKDQASRDRRRDRDLQAGGWMVMRYTGSDIFRQASWCAKECFDLVMGQEANP